MPAKCPWCETNTHGDSDKAEYPVCVRKFLTPSEAWAIIAEDKKPSEYVHVFVNPKPNMLIGGDRSRKEIKTILENAKHIELCDAKGTARGMKHGVCVTEDDGRALFVETNEDRLKAYEELYCNG